MLEIKIDRRKSIYENINDIYSRLKVLKDKKKKIEEIIKDYNEKLNNIEENIVIEKKKEEKKKNRKWYEKFRWTKTSNDFLLIAGKDSITNEIIINKYLEDNDIVFHTEITGSPFGILKNGRKAREEDIYESAKFVASYSRAWKNKFSSIDVYYVYPDQVSKKAPSGEYLNKGSFMIYGNKNYIKNVKLEIALSFDNYEIFSGVPEVITKKYQNYAIVVPGNKKQLDIAKELSKIFKIDHNDIIIYLPGDSDLYLLKGSNVYKSFYNK
ncbi:fibronectin-binding A domain protein [Nanobdella aerobiophila]|uniref:Fibronectin-binding A domain protein n=1 Tax=Nanobdella aerobiophila TaxID=2586965 RepID=A0A915WT05_9ARCH|nr:NFACT family protein [Nanobdella aerobiophila]BBL45850.1 fibronectin-binding A domain protein [Nanobdella aerobiophila]